ncbi:hypothetical protein LIER_31925 [Lithospermum erythrorhizon]|uniref:Integrase catalytic domain-containing protein n=1 Tax=Lithospermum erythrorhizon TaxID=34254 RepID=A0AAV3RWF3_LITER
MFSSGRVQWKDHLSIHGNFEYIPGYWEWVEDVLSRCDRVLGHALLNDAVNASLYVYECWDALLKVFCESWCPSTNNLIIHQGELSIPLWDLLRLGGLPVTWRDTRPDRDRTFYLDDGVSHSVFDRAFFISVRTGKVCHRVGLEFVVEPYNPCQRHPIIPHQPPHEMVSMLCPITFYQWGVDIVGDLPRTSGSKRYAIVVVDYFTKWVEAKPLPKWDQDSWSGRSKPMLGAGYRSQDMLGGVPSGQWPGGSHEQGELQRRKETATTGGR